MLLSWSFWTNNFIVMYFILNWVIKRKLNIYSIEVQKLFNDSDSDIFSKEFLNKIESEFLIVKIKIKRDDITHISITIAKLKYIDTAFTFMINHN